MSKPDYLLSLYMNDLFTIVIEKELVVVFEGMVQSERKRKGLKVDDPKWLPATYP